jgi:hypothetical protein
MAFLPHGFLPVRLCSAGSDAVDCRAPRFHIPGIHGVGRIIIASRPHRIGEQLLEMENDKAVMCKEFTEYSLRDGFVKKR